jgi:hypothetical protein
VSRRRRWAIGVAIFLSAYLVGYLLSRVPAAGDLDGVISVVGMAVLSWLVPVMLKRRPTAEEREAGRERRKKEHLEALTTGRPGYGQLRNLVVRVDDDTGAFLWKVERDGIYEVVSAAPGSAKVGGYGQQYSYTEFLLLMKPGATSAPPRRTHASEPKPSGGSASGVGGRHDERGGN